MIALAIDQGTTSTRAVLVDADGRVEVAASRPNPASHPRDGWVEQDAERLLDDVRRCLEAGLDAVGRRAGDARGAGATVVGIDNQGESCLAWDADTGRAVSPVISWQDRRTADAVARLEADGAGALVRARAGLPLDAYFSAAKLGWIVTELPEAGRLAARGRLRLGTTDAFFRDRLTGRFETDVTTASRTSLMNLERGAWDEELCALFGVPVDALPAIGPSAGDLGTLGAGGRDVPLGASLVDQQASLYGHGCRERGDAKMTFGTGAFASAVVGAAMPADRPDADDGPGRGPDEGPGDGPGGPLPTVAWRREGEATVHALDGGVHAAAAAVEWARGLGLFAELAELDRFEGPSAIERGVAFVPALVGLGCPHWDRRARGAWLGLGPATDARDLARAVLEGVALRMAEVVASIERLVPLNGPIPVDGGMAANPAFTDFLSAALGRELLVSDEPELTALGTAMLAAEAIGRPIARERSGRRVAAEPLPAEAHRAFTAAREAVARFGATAGTSPSERVAS